MLKDTIFNKLKLIRIYLKQPGKKADRKEPMILFENATLHDLCLKIHKDFVDKFKFARSWGNSVKYDGQMKRKLKHVLFDEDVVELHRR